MLDKLTVIVVVITVVATLAGVDAAADPMEYAACPQRHHPEFYCCVTSSTTREVYIKFQRPTGGSYEEDYKIGWNQPRQVNFPYVRYTPDTPIFMYDDPKSICRIQTIVKFETGELQQKLQCGSEIASLVKDSQVSSVFWTSPSNPRNNNASFPIGAQCVSLMQTDGSVDEDNRNLSVSDKQLDDFQFTSFGETPLVVVYFIYLICFALLAWWNFHRHFVYRKNPSTIEDDKGVIGSNGAADLNGIISHTRYELIMENNSETQCLVQTGYSCSKQGQAVFIYFVMATVLLHILVVIVICDYYGSFTPHLFDPLSASATVFFLVWLFAAVWLIAIVVLQKDLPNFFPRTKSAAQL